MSGSASAPGPELSVVLLTRDAGPRFAEVLDGLFGCRGIERAEVLVLDSGSSDGTPELAASRPGVQVVPVRPEEFGHGRTRNLGAGLARGEVLVFLVQDATPAAPDFLERLTAPLAEDPRLAATYGRQLPRPEASPVEAEFLRQTYPERPEVRLIEGPREPIRIGSIFFSNVCSAIRRSVWQAFPFDETMIMSEDQQWARDVLAAGHLIRYEPSAVVLHSHGYGWKRVFQRNFDSGYSLRGVAEDSFGSMVRYELRFLLETTRSLWRRGQALSIPRLAAHEAARGLGFLLGRHAHRLPHGLRASLSLHKHYWKPSGEPPSARASVRSNR